MKVRARALMAYVVAVLASLAVFVLYTRPETMVLLADQIWSCFQ